MKRRGIYIGLLLAVVGGLVWLLLSPGEPKYQGKPLSYWLQAYDIFGRAAANSNHTYNGPSSVEAAEALRQIGTNAFPRLLQMLEEKDSALKLKLAELIQKQHVVKINFVPASWRNVQASRALQALSDLGFDLRPALPGLINIFGKNVSASSVTQTSGVIARFGHDGTQAVPALMRGITNTDEHVRLSSLLTLCAIGRDGNDWILNELTNTLHETNSRLQTPMYMWFSTYGQFGGTKVQMSPLVRELQNLNEDGQIGVLSMVGPSCREESKSVGPEVATMLHDPLPLMRQLALFALQRLYLNNPVAPGAEVVSALVETLKDPDPLVRDAAGRVLKRLDPQAAAKAGVQ